MRFSKNTATLSLVFIAFVSSIIASVLYNRAVKRDEMRDGFEAESKTSSCPDMLVRRNGKIVLYKSNADPTDGEFPKTFESIDEYIQYAESNQTSCQVLYLQEETDAQGNEVLRARPNPFQMNAGAPIVPAHPAEIGVAIPPLGAAAPRWPAPTNTTASTYASFDAHGFDNGTITGVDILHASTSTRTGECSENQMDSNWCGVAFTESAVAHGKYAENEIYIIPQPSANPRK